MNDPARWQARYIIYRDLGPRRTLYGAFLAATPNTRAIETPPTWLDAFDRYRWRERAHAYDREQQAEKERETAEVAASEKRDRVTILKAARAKVVKALSTTAENDQDFPRIVSEVTALTDQLRRETEE